MLRTAALACFLIAGSAAEEAKKTVEEAEKPAEETTKAGEASKTDPPKLRGKKAATGTPAGGASGQSVGWTHFKFSTKSTRGAESDSVQLAEIYFYANGQRLPLLGAPPTASDPLGYSPDGQDASKAVDGNIETKWLDFQKQYLEITYQTPQNPDAWSFVTGNDQDERDPVDFTMEVSQDEKTWTLVTEVKGFADIARSTESQHFKITAGGVVEGSGSDGGCGGGCAFLIIFFAGGFVYFAAGFAYNFQRKELRGAEAIPQVGFWKDLPFLVKDGALFVVAKVSGRGSYASV